MPYLLAVLHGNQHAEQTIWVCGNYNLSRVLDFYLAERFRKRRVLLMGLLIRLSAGFPVEAAPPLGLYFGGGRGLRG